MKGAFEECRESALKCGLISFICAMKAALRLAQSRVHQAVE
jgi:hypothetical protein